MIPCLPSCILPSFDHGHVQKCVLLHSCTVQAHMQCWRGSIPILLRYYPHRDADLCEHRATNTTLYGASTSPYTCARTHTLKVFVKDSIWFFNLHFTVNTSGHVSSSVCLSVAHGLERNAQNVKYLLIS